MWNRCSIPASGAALLLLLIATCPAWAGTSKPLGFNHDIRPILSDNCLFCHGPDPGQRKGKFRLDQRDSVLAKGAIVPGSPEKSSLIERIFSDDPEQVMPPPESHKSLTPAQKEILKQWIAQGAPYEPFWAYVVPQRPATPTVRDSHWVSNPIDTFVLSELETLGLHPVAEADRRTLLRRLSLDLIGLPPTPGEVEDFLADNSPNAYEKQVDRLLASPHYGERMAVPWLDAVRYADTVGFHGDQNQNVFPYRDYVINAFNSNKPFDQFTIEQLAGDLLPHPTPEQLTATGFNRLNMMTREGGAQAKEYLAKYAADRVRTLGVAFLGSTLACCECHDHKFDPFTTKDFYSLESFWADVREWGIYADYKYTSNPDLRGYDNDSPFPPELVVDSPYLKHRKEKLIAQLDRLVDQSTIVSHADKASQWQHSVSAFLADHPDGWETLAVIPSAKGASSEPVATLTGDGKKSEQVACPIESGTMAAIRLEVLPVSPTNAQSPAMKPAKEEFVRFNAAIRHSDGTSSPLSIEFADASQKHIRYSNGYEVEGILGKWQLDPAAAETSQTAVYVLRQPIQCQRGNQLVITLEKNVLRAVRISVSPLATIQPMDKSFVPSIATAIHEPASGAQSLLNRTMLLSSTDPADQQLRTQADQLCHEILACHDGTWPTLVVVSQKPRPMRVLRRGNWQDEGGDVVTPTIPAFLQSPGTPAPTPSTRLTRLDLAKWLVSRQNPLTSRAVINRIWKQFFGVGITNTLEDLGSQGDPPADPELLDWLAVEFEQSGWDVKHMVKLIVMSSAYRESSSPSPELLRADVFDRLSGWQMPRRLDAEFVRDNALFAAGLLNLDDIGGPSNFPYQPEGYYAAIQFPDRQYIPDSDDRQYRRGLYTHWQRTFLHPMLANFDAPSREDAICTRNISNTPLQALTLLNDPEFVEAARVLAEKALQSRGGDSMRINFVFSRVLCRPATNEEIQSLTTFLDQQRKTYRDNPADAAALCAVGNSPVQAADTSELAAFTSVCRVVMNLHESITRY